MNLVRGYLSELSRATLTGWNRFWFTPADAATLGLIRILAGAMLFYTHLVWALDLDDFFGPASWVSAEAADLAVRLPERANWAWSYLWLVRSPALLWTVHLAALAVFAMLALGLWTRVVSVLAFLAAVSYVNRVPGALFGLDQINCLLAMYLVVGPSGDAYSLDRWLARRRGQAGQAPPAPTTTANLAIRLMQIHMCVIYFFAALGKLRGDTWWSGGALWLSFANLEYQSLDMTWTAGWDLPSAIATQVTVYWELFFCVLVWPRLTRPLMLAIAVPVHLGIAVCMGMITFGLVMLIGCLSFVPPWLVRRLIDRRSEANTPSEAGQGRGARGARRPASQRAAVGSREGRG